MAFPRRRGTFRRFPRRGPPPSKIARKRTDWVTLLNIPCEPIVHPLHGCPDAEGSPPEPERINLTDSVILENHDDNTTLVRLVGQLVFVPFFDLVFSSPPTPAEVALELTRRYRFAAGLRVVEDTSLGSTPIADPLFSDDDMSDARWLKSWNLFKIASFDHHFQSLLADWPVGSCSNVSAAAAGAPANTLSNGSGTVNIPAISTDCCSETCVLGTNDDIHSETVTAKTMPNVTISLNLKKRIRLREDQKLVFDFNYSNGGLATPQVGFARWGWLKGLFQYG